MFSFASFAKSTLGELKGALAEDSDDEEDETEVPTLHQSPSGNNSKDPLHPTEEAPIENAIEFRARVAREQAAKAIEAARAAAEENTAAAAIGESDILFDHTANGSKLSGIHEPPVAHPPSVSAQDALSTQSSGLDVSLQQHDADTWVDGAFAIEPTILDRKGDADDDNDARKLLCEMCEMPGLDTILARLQGASCSSTLEALWRECGNLEASGRLEAVAALSISRIAVVCAEMASLLAPMALVADAEVEPQRVVAELNSRIAGFRQRCIELQTKCSLLDDDKKSAEARAARAGDRVAQTSNGQFSSGFAGGKVDVDEHKRLLRKLAQRDSELQAAGEALRRLQEVMDDGDGEADLRRLNLEVQLQQAQRMAAHAEAQLASEKERSQKLVEELRSYAPRIQDLENRCRLSERELLSSNLALETLLKEKERHLEERDYAVDRRLVVSALDLCKDHFQTGDRELAEQALDQALRVVGCGATADFTGERKRIRVAAAEAAQRERGPLADAFLDFLSKEAGGEVVGSKSLAISSATVA